MIPKTLHIVWIGDPGTEPVAGIQRWRDLNPTFDLQVWGNEQLSAGQWRTRTQMRSLLATDLHAVMECVRYEVVSRFGGVAVDALTVATEPLPDWLLDTEAFALWVDELEEPGVLSTALLGAEPGNPFFNRVLEEIASNERVDRGDTRFTVGNQRLTAIWRSMRYPLTVYPSHYLAPTFGDKTAYLGRGLVLGELVKPAQTESGASLPDPAVATAKEQAYSLQELPFPTHVEGAPPLTASFELPPVEAPPPVDVPDSEAAGSYHQSDTSTGEVVMMAADEPLTWQDIAARIRGFDEGTPSLDSQNVPAIEPGAEQAPARFRVVVGTDWSSATVPLAILKAYAVMIPSHAPVDLVFAVPHEPSEEDAACVRTLLEGIGNADTAGLTIESFDEAGQYSCYAAVVPTGDHDGIVMEVASALTTLHQLAATVSDPKRLALEPAPRPGPNAGLRRRLASYRESQPSQA